MKDIVQVDKEIKNIIDSQARLQAELDELQGKEQVTLKQIGESILSGDGSAATGDLAGMRIRKEAVSQALDLARRKLQQARDERVSIQRAEIGGRWLGIDKDLRQRLAKIRDLASDLKGELDRLAPVLAEGQSISGYTSQDTEIWLRAVENLCSAWSRDLDSLWASLDHLNR